MVNQERKTEIANGLEIAMARINLAAKSANRNPSDISLIVVTKTFPRSDADFLYELGVRDFGENRDQEGVVKAENFHPDAKWHFQGKIQGNKIKSIVKWTLVGCTVSPAFKFQHFEIARDGWEPAGARA